MCSLPEGMASSQRIKRETYGMKSKSLIAITTLQQLAESNAPTTSSALSRNTARDGSGIMCGNPSRLTSGILCRTRKIMTKKELWDGLCARHPEFKDYEYVLKQRARGLRAIINQAFDEGHTKGVENGRAMERLQNQADRKKNPFGGLLKS